MLAPVTQRPDVVRQRRDLGRGELRSAHRGHHAHVLLRVRYAVGDRLGNGRDAAVAPQPFGVSEVGRERRALGVRSVAADACATALAVIDTAAERDHRRCCSGRSRQRSGCVGPSVWMDAFGRPHVRNGSRSSGTGATGGCVGCRIDPRRGGLARVDDPPDPSAHVVRDVERAIGRHRESRWPMRGLPWFFHRSGEAIGEDLVVTGGLAAGVADGRPEETVRGSKTRGMR